MNPVGRADFFLPRQECVGSRIADCEKTDEFVAFRSIDESLDLFGFITDRNMEHTSKSFGCGCQKHVLECAPGGGEVVERTQFGRMQKRSGELAENGMTSKPLSMSIFCCLGSASPSDYRKRNC